MGTEHEFEPGQAPVYPLARRQPWESFARWGMPPEPGSNERLWDSPAPWTARRPSGPPMYAVAAIVVGVVMVLTSVIALAFLAG